MTTTTTPDQCPETFRELRCELPADHRPADIHRDGKVTWGFRDPFVPEWIRRRRDGLTSLARDETGAVLNR